MTTLDALILGSAKTGSQTSRRPARAGTRAVLIHPAVAEGLQTAVMRLPRHRVS